MERIQLERPKVKKSSPGRDTPTSLVPPQAMLRPGTANPSLAQSSLEQIRRAIARPVITPNHNKSLIQASLIGARQTLLMAGGTITHSARAKKVFSLGIYHSTYDKLLDALEDYEKAEKSKKKKKSALWFSNQLDLIEKLGTEWLEDPAHQQEISEGDDLAIRRSKAITHLLEQVSDEREQVNELSKGAFIEFEISEEKSKGKEKKERKRETKEEKTLPVTNDFTDEELQIHLRAYKGARYYHATKMEHVESISKIGLDPKHGGKGGSDEAEGRNLTWERVYLGGDMTTTLYYQGVLRKHNPQFFRAFLTPKELESLAVDMGDEDNLAYWTPLAVKPEQMIRGKFAEQSKEKLLPIFEIVRQHYPEKDRPDTPEEVMARHFEAITKKKTIHKWGEKANKQTRYGERAYQARDEGYESD